MQVEVLAGEQVPHEAAREALAVVRMVAPQRLW